MGQGFVSFSGGRVSKKSPAAGQIPGSIAEKRHCPGALLVAGYTHLVTSDMITVLQFQAFQVCVCKTEIHSCDFSK